MLSVPRGKVAETKRKRSKREKQNILRIRTTNAVNVVIAIGVTVEMAMIEMAGVIDLFIVPHLIALQGAAIVKTIVGAMMAWIGGVMKEVAVDVDVDAGEEIATMVLIGGEMIVVGAVAEDTEAVGRAIWAAEEDEKVDETWGDLGEEEEATASLVTGDRGTTWKMSLTSILPMIVVVEAAGGEAAVAEEMFPSVLDTMKVLTMDMLMMAMVTEVTTTTMGMDISRIHQFEVDEEEEAAAEAAAQAVGVVSSKKWVDPPIRVALEEVAREWRTALMGLVSRTALIIRRLWSKHPMVVEAVSGSVVGASYVAAEAADEAVAGVLMSST